MSYQARGRIQRLARREEKATIKRIVWLSIISLVLAVLLFTVGISALGKFTDLLGTVFKGKDSGSATSDTLTTPTLENLPSATNSAKLAIKGIAVDGESVDVVLNGNVFGSSPVVDSKFDFEDLILKNGANDINVVSKKGKTTSESSKVIAVILKTSEPSLTIDSPTDGQNFQGDNHIKVSGKTDKDSQVYANGFLASVDLDGKFDVLVPVSEGETTIEIKALDSAGNTKIEKRKIVYRKS